MSSRAGRQRPVFGGGTDGARDISAPAQRDVIDLTLIAAAARAGQVRQARALVAERAARKPTAEAAARQLLEANSS